MSLIALPPNRDNIRYVVQQKTSLDDLSSSIAAEIVGGGIHVSKTVVFCCKLVTACYTLYLLKSELKECMTDSVGAAGLQRFRVIDMYTSGSMIAMLEKLLMSLSQVGSKVEC